MGFEPRISGVEFDRSAIELTCRCINTNSFFFRAELLTGASVMAWVMAQARAQIRFSDLDLGSSALKDWRWDRSTQLSFFKWQCGAEFHTCFFKGRVGYFIKSYAKIQGCVILSLECLRHKSIVLLVSYLYHCIVNFEKKYCILK